jgi:hypothetical protein
MTIEEELQRKQIRLNNYYDQETKILSDGVQAYGIGSRSIQRYQVALAEVRSAIKELELEVKALERKMCGRSPNRSFSVVPTDW